MCIILDKLSYSSTWTSKVVNDSYIMASILHSPYRNDDSLPHDSYTADDARVPLYPWSTLTTNN